MTVRVINYKKLDKPPLVGFIDVHIPEFHQKIFGLTLFQKDGQRWINMPSQKFINENGETKYAPHIKWDSEQATEGFRKAVLAALEEYVLEGKHEDR